MRVANKFSFVWFTQYKLHWEKANHYRLCFWPGLCTAQSRPSSSVTTVSWAVDRLSSSAVGSTISIELHIEHTRITKDHTNKHRKQIFLSWMDKRENHSLTCQRHRKRHRLDACEYAVHASFLNSRLVYPSLCWWWPLGVELWGAGQPMKLIC